MQVICKDGTTFQCQDFEATDSGVLLFQESLRRDEEGEDEAEEEQSATGFVPITELRFVVSDEVMQRKTAEQRERGQPGQAPPGAPPQRTGQVAQQQQMSRSPGTRGRQPPGRGGQ